MQNIYSRTFAPLQVLKPAEWNTVELDKPGEFSFISDQPGNYSINASFQFANVPVGDAVQVRLAVVDDTGAIVIQTPVIEIPGTTGSTFGGFTRFLNTVEKERVRVLVAAFTPGIILTKGDVQWHS